MINLLAVNIESVFNKTPFKRGESDVASLVSLFLTGAITVSGVVFVIGVILGGINLMKSAGSGNASDLQKSQKMMVGAGVGFLLVISAYAVLKLVEEVFFNGANVFDL